MGAPHHARACYEHVFRAFGISESRIRDRGPVWVHVCFSGICAEWAGKEENTVPVLPWGAVRSTHGAGTAEALSSGVTCLHSHTLPS